MKPSYIVTLLFSLFVFATTTLLLLPDEALAARFGGGSSVGSRGSKSFSTPRQATPRNATQPTHTPSQQAAPAPGMGSRWGSGLLGGLGGLMLGGLLGSMLFGGEGGGLGLLEILLIGGGIFFLIRWLNRRKAGTSLPETGTAAFSPAHGGQPMSTEFPTSNRISLAKNPLPQTFSMGGGSGHGVVDEVSQGLAQIASMDPGFNEIHFMNGAKGAYQQIQSAWSDWSVDRLRPLLTERMWGIIQGQAQTRQAAGRRDIVEKIRFDVAEISEAWQEAGENWITVHFVVDLVEYETDVAGRVTNGNPNQSIQAEEYWTFCRPVGSSNPNWLLSAVQQPGEVARSMP